MILKSTLGLETIGETSVTNRLESNDDDNVAKKVRENIFERLSFSVCYYAELGMHRTQTLVRCSGANDSRSGRVFVNIVDIFLR